MEKKHLFNVNSSGQGSDPGHALHPLHATVASFGYVYSHSVNVGTLAGDGWHIHHCYRFPESEHRVCLRDVDRGIYRECSGIWSTKTTPASGHEWDGKGEAELRAHLKSKARRYGLKH